MATSEVILLKSSLDYLCKSYSVKLTSTEIYWQSLSSSNRVPASGPYSEPLVKNESQSIKLKEVVSVHLGKLDTKQEGKFQSVELEPLSPTSFSIWVIKRMPKHRWRDRKLTFTSRDTHVIQQWVDKIQALLNNPDFKRPKSLLVFVNPFGGAKKAPSIFRQKIAPLFDLAKLNYEVVSTLRPNHARDTILNYDLKKIDGLVSVGGDGMFIELLHGLMSRVHQDNGMDNPGPNTPLLRPELRIGTIPAGSTNTVAYSTNGTDDPVTAALHIIIGDSIAMDVATVHHGNQFLKYNVSLLGYGYYGDCILDSENFRWMGPKRYDWSGLKKLLGNKAYEGEITYLPSGDTSNHPRDNTLCHSRCTVCSTAADDMKNEQEIDITVREEEQKWQTIRGTFLCINSFLISCRSHFSIVGPAPTAHFGDGCLDLVLVKDCDRTDFFKHLYRCTKPNKDQFDFPFVHVVRVKEFKFRSVIDDIEESHTDSELDGGEQSLKSRAQFTSCWNCDGEILEQTAVDVRAHKQVVKLFSRGIEEEPMFSHSQCFPCHCSLFN